jgi:hypothetical protein
MAIALKKGLASFKYYDQYNIEPRLRLAFVLWLHGTSAIASYSTLRHGKLLL